MCGIAGFVTRSPLEEKDRVVGKRMLDAQIHRGPDGSGTYEGQHVWLGMRRLSIIDLEGGWQPFYSEDRSIAVVANGEIYNYIELRERLIGKGHVFSSKSDCETIVHLYEEYGEGCVHHLRGMFAFAIWDINRQKLFLARDRMGEKPLYLYKNTRGMYFSSELKSLLSSGVVPFELELPNVDLYLHYMYVPEPLTMIRGVSKLPAGHTMTVDITKWEKKTHCYWRMEDAPVLDGNPVELLDAQLQEIGKQIIRSDVPVGVALSGGLDSSLVAALAARYSPQKIHALTVGYEGSVESDERGAAKKFAQYLDIPWTDIQLSTSEVIAGLPELVLRMDDPIGDIAGYGYYAVMRGAREQNLPVMLQGQGGDELFWGYSWVRDAAARSRLKALATQHGWKAFGDYWRAELPCSKSIKDIRRWFKKLVGLSPALRKLQYDCSTPRNQLAFYNMSNEYQAAEELKHQLFSKTYLHDLPEYYAASLFSKDELWKDIDASLTKLICETYLLENGMAQGDRLSMASSVELRLPLVDYRFVETVIGIRKNKTDYNDTPKKHLRDVAAAILPDWVMNRKKRGFSPPVDQWMNGIQMRYGMNLNDGFLIRQGILDQSTTHSLTKSPPKRGPMRNVWHALIVLELWSREMEGLASKSSQDD